MFASLELPELLEQSQERGWAFAIPRQETPSTDIDIPGTLVPRIAQWKRKNKIASYQALVRNSGPRADAARYPTLGSPPLMPSPPFGSWPRLNRSNIHLSPGNGPVTENSQFANFDLTRVDSSTLRHFPRAAAMGRSILSIIAYRIFLQPRRMRSLSSEEEATS